MTLAGSLSKSRSPERSTTRTNGDWVMILLGVFLIMLFLFAACLSYVDRGAGPSQRMRGPVKSPGSLGELDGDKLSRKAPHLEKMRLQ